MKKKTLQEIRDAIDAVDGQLVDLLARRAALSEEVGRIKKDSGTAVFAPDREELLLQRLEKWSDGRVPSNSLRAIFREILSASRLKQKQLWVAYLGPESSHSHLAARERFGASDAFLPCRDIAEIFQVVTRGAADLGIVPVENSIEGGVAASLDALVNTELVICGEVYLRISHSLMSRQDTRDIRRIYSHPQAIGQCRQWLNTHLPGIELVEVSSTSEGARRAAAESDSAAIASEVAAPLHQLEILHRNIQDQEKNFTRFLILNKEMPGPTRHDKTSLLFAVSHEVGALNQILQLFASYHINLDKIESRPAANKTWEYLFFVDVKGHCEKKPLKEALREIKPKTLWLKILGSYPETTYSH